MPGTGSGVPKAADPPERINPDPAADTGRVPACGAGLDAGYEQLRHAALHTRTDAFPLGLAVLTGKGITAWRHALSDLAGHPPIPARPTPPAHPERLPARITAELIDALAALALAGT